MSRIFPEVDPDGLLEFSVVFTDRSLNHMSVVFQEGMRRLYAQLCQVYSAKSLALIPGGGSFGMEAIARQFIQQQPCVIIRNGWFSYRWSQIIECGALTDQVSVLKAQSSGGRELPQFSPFPIEQAVREIEKTDAKIVFAPHVETASGMRLPDDYIQQLSNAVHEQGGLMVLDCVASGALWVDMEALGVDVLLTAPQKGWSSSPCAGAVLFSERALEQMAQTQSSSFAADLKQWHQIMMAYQNGGHAYHATMPTEGIMRFEASVRETLAVGLEALTQAQIELGQSVRAFLQEQGFQSVTAKGFESPTVVVSHAPPSRDMGKEMMAKGLQIAQGVPLMCDEPEHFQSFRLGLFGLDKLQDQARTLGLLQQAFQFIGKAVSV